MRDPSDRRTADLLPAALYVVETRRQSGEWRPFSTYREPAHAAAVAARLRQAGADAEARVVPAEDRER